MRIMSLAARQKSIGNHLESRTKLPWSLPVGFDHWKKSHKDSERNEEWKAALSGLSLESHREQRMSKALKHNLNATSFSEPNVLYDVLRKGSDGKVAKRPSERNVRLLRLSWMLERAAKLKEDSVDNGAGCVPCPAMNSTTRRQHSTSHPSALKRRQQLEKEEAQQAAGQSRIFLDVEEIEQLDANEPLPTFETGCFRMHVACWSYCWETPEHSDPNGRTLLAFADEIERLRAAYPAFPAELGIFVDFCSIHQHHMETPAISSADASRRTLVSYRSSKPDEFQLEGEHGGLGKRTVRVLFSSVGQAASRPEIDFERAMIERVDAGSGLGSVTLLLKQQKPDGMKLGFGSRSGKAGARVSPAPVVQLKIDNPPCRRSAVEEAGFRRALDSMHLLYCHAAVTVFVLSDSALDTTGTPVPPRMFGYFDSGWTTFEMTASRVTKDMHSLHTAGQWPGVIQVGEVTKAQWRPFEPPACPEEFYERIRSGKLHFTNQKDDSELVGEKYELTLVHAMRDKLSFKFHDSGWTDSDAMRFARTLALCQKLVYLNLSRNAIGDDGLGSLAAAFESGCAPSLKGLWLGDNAFGAQGLQALAMAVGNGLHEKSSIAAKRRFGFWGQSRSNLSLRSESETQRLASDVCRATAGSTSTARSIEVEGGRLQKLMLLDLSQNLFGHAPTAMLEFVKKLPSGALRSLRTLHLGGCLLGGRGQVMELLGEIEFSRKVTGALSALEEIVGIDLDIDGGELNEADADYPREIIEGVRLLTRSVAQLARVETLARLSSAHTLDLT